MGICTHGSRNGRKQEVQKMRGVIETSSCASLLVHSHVLVQIIVSAEYLAATRMRALVRFIMCMNAAHMPLEMLSTLETLAADLA